MSWIPRDRQILYLDMNAFFASVEQQANPLLRSQPVAISPVHKPYGCVIAKSYEAKRAGIKTGDRLRRWVEIQWHLRQCQAGAQST